VSELPKGLGEPTVLRGNEPLLLEDFGDWWVVCSGSVALFSVALRDREPWGARHHLFNVEAGEALFGLGAHLNHIDRGVLAVPLGEASLAKGDEVDLGDWRAAAPQAFEATMLRWADHWSNALDLAPPDRSGDWLTTLPVFSGPAPLPLWRVSVPAATPPLGLPGDQLIDWAGAQRWIATEADAETVRAAATAAGGHATRYRGGDETVPAFHPLPDALLALHRRLKAALDPAGVFNPGRMYGTL